MVDARRERDFDCVARELEVDEDAGPVAWQTAHPQLVEVVAQLLDADAQIGRRFGVGDARAGLKVRDHVQQPDKPGGDGGHPVTLSVSPACARRRAMTSSRSDWGSSATASGP